MAKPTTIVCGVCGIVWEGDETTPCGALRWDKREGACAGLPIRQSDAAPFTLNPARIRALSPQGRVWFAGVMKRLAESNARAVKRTPTLAELSPTIADRNDRLWQWANAIDWRKAKRDAVKASALTMVAPARKPAKMCALSLFRPGGTHAVGAAPGCQCSTPRDERDTIPCPVRQRQIARQEGERAALTTLPPVRARMVG